MLAALQQERKWGVERGSAAWSFCGWRLGPFVDWLDIQQSYDKSWHML